MTYNLLLVSLCDVLFSVSQILLLMFRELSELILSKDKFDDDVYNYNCVLLVDGLFFLNFLDVVSEGDGLRLMRQYKYMLFYCRVDGYYSNKYLLECLYQLFCINFLLFFRDCERFIWNRFVNNRGGRGNNIVYDLEVEYSNLYNKISIKNLGLNVIEKVVQ